MCDCDDRWDWAHFDRELIERARRRKWVATHSADFGEERAADRGSLGGMGDTRRLEDAIDVRR